MQSYFFYIEYFSSLLYYIYNRYKTINNHQIKSVVILWRMKEID